MAALGHHTNEYIDLLDLNMSWKLNLPYYICIVFAAYHVICLIFLWILFCLVFVLVFFFFSQNFILVNIQLLLSLF